MEIQQKVILLIEESEPILLSSQEKMVAYLLSNSDTDMNKLLSRDLYKRGQHLCHMPITLGIG